MQHYFKSLLQFGMKNTEVAILQDALRIEGMFPVEQASTGYFGKITYDALRAYQSKKGLKLTGITDQATNNELNKKFNMREIKFLVVHHSAGPKNETAQDVNRWHKVRNWGTTAKPLYCSKSTLGWYIQYHYYIDRAGKVWQARTDEEIGWHAGVWDINTKSIGICLSGNFNIEMPNQNQIDALTKLLKELSAKYNVPPDKIHPHRFFKQTDCYGQNLAEDWASNLIK